MTERMQGRDVLPIPDQPNTELITFDAKDPDTKFPPIEPIRPPTGAPPLSGTSPAQLGFRVASSAGGSPSPLATSTA